jgi:hypothetical protein
VTLVDLVYRELELKHVSKEKEGYRITEIYLIGKEINKQ